MPTQMQMYRNAERKAAALDNAFMDMLKGPNPLTKAELEALIAKRPEVYGRFANWLRVLK